MSYAEMMDAGRSLPRREKLQLLQQLAAELATEEGMADASGGIEHPIWSPYEAFDAASTLQGLLDAEKAGGS